MKVKYKSIITIFIYIMLFAITVLCIKQMDSFIQVSKYGTLIIIFLFITNIVYFKKVITPMNILLLCFVLFQFGLPILYAVNSHYTNWYLLQFDETSLIKNAYFTILCIESFSFGLVLSSERPPKKSINKYFLSDDNSKLIYSFSKILLLITGLIAIPLGMYVSYLGLKHGYNYIKIDSMHIYNGLTKFAQEYIVAALLLCIVYSDDKKKKRFYMIISMCYALILIFSGARTVSLAILLVLLFIKSDNNIKNKAVRAISISIGIIILSFAGSFIAEQRLKGETTKTTIPQIVESVVEEMGFNFTTINFVDAFVPSTYKYQYGMTYLKSIICLIPKSLDPTKTIEKIYYTLPERELAEWLGYRYGDLYSFGVGYSVVAEAYYNFGQWGVISVFVQGLIIGKIIKGKKQYKNKFSTYTEYVLLYALLTYPRRSFTILLKCIEYYIVFIILAIYILSRRIKKGKNTL